jgi:pimeloyl-ACP methyl ester carboxylesterase
MDNVGASSPVLSAEIHFHRVALRTGVTLAYAEQGDPAGPFVIFLHGFADSWHSFSRILPLLSPAYHVYALDQRGQGNSAKPSGAYTQAEFAADVIAFMDALGINTAMLVGDSMGSFIAQRVAQHYPARVTRLVLIASAPTTIGHPAIRAFQEWVLTLRDPLDRNVFYKAQTSGLMHPVPADFVNTAIDENMKVPATVMQAIITDMVEGDDPVDLTSILAPTLIAWGDQDALFSLADQQTLVAQIPQSTLKIYEATGHSPHWELPQAFVRNLEAFLQQETLQF